MAETSAVTLLWSSSPKMPVLAGGDTLSYRASKFIRRHGVAVTAAVLGMLSLVSKPY